MVRAKNYETMSKFVKVMPRNTVASFLPDTVYNGNTALKAIVPVVHEIHSKLPLVHPYT